eukprot:TRINITY_DN1994_c0_g6_i2.p1 TRINITY_DN1994_c0_g6~~TRINITY_DN1994_c0_g6_i2.p1  ORF type:complete len:148 (+),score=24.59 TRINITY_DN1994_c0_g6_i2:72-515(+)
MCIRDSNSVGTNTGAEKRFALRPSALVNNGNTNNFGNITSTLGFLSTSASQLSEEQLGDFKFQGRGRLQKISSKALEDSDSEEKAIKMDVNQTPPSKPVISSNQSANRGLLPISRSLTMPSPGNSGAPLDANQYMYRGGPRVKATGR